MIEVDVARKRIALTRRLAEKTAPSAQPKNEPRASSVPAKKSYNSPSPTPKAQGSAPIKTGTMADLFAKAGLKK